MSIDLKKELDLAKQVIEQKAKLTLYHAEQAEYWWKKYHCARRRLVHARLLLRELKKALHDIGLR